jgi:hypothetical protein
LIGDAGRSGFRTGRLQNFEPLPYYNTTQDQENALAPNGPHGISFEQMAADYHISYCNTSKGDLTPFTFSPLFPSFLTYQLLAIRQGTT